MRQYPLLVFLVIINCLLSFKTQAQPLPSLTLKDVTVKELQAIYDKYGYSHYLIVKNAEIPPIFLEHFPKDFDKLPASDERNELFIRILTPLALKINQEIMSEREHMLKLEKSYLSKQSLTTKEEQELEALAKKYDVFTRLKGKDRIELYFNQLKIKINQVYPSFLISISAVETDWGSSRIVQEANSLYKELVWHTPEGLTPQGEERIKLYFNQLKIKINQVYPSFLISIAAVETDWGSSRIVKEANSLYKELVWHTPEGLTPQGENEDHTYKIRIFPNLYESMKSYALKFNSNISYEHARFLRDLRYRSEIVPSGKGVVHAMLFQSPLKNYIGILDYTITFYQLMLLDQATLAAKLVPD